MTQPPHEQDVQRRIRADNSLAHVEDQERQISALEREAPQLLAPIKHRKIANHFQEEAIALLNRRLGK